MRHLSITFLIPFFFAPFFSLAGIQYDDASFYLEKGKIEIDEGMFDFARENLERAYKLDPGNFEISALLGDLYLKLKQKQHALDLYRESLSINDNQDITHVKAGELEDYFGNNASALEHYLKACGLNHRNSKAYLGAARAFSLGKETEKADEYFQKSYLLKKSESDPFENKADSFYAVKKFTEAIESLKKAIEINGAARDLYFRIASIERLRGNPKGALAWLEKLAFLKPHDEKVFIELAFTYYSERSYRNRHAEMVMAAGCIEKALSINTTNPRAHELASEIYETLGDREKSLLHKKLTQKENESDKTPTLP
jgi:tetratricopeptide (TPR) repeat protein